MLLQPCGEASQQIGALGALGGRLRRPGGLSARGGNGGSVYVGSPLSKSVRPSALSVRFTVPPDSGRQPELKTHPVR